MANPSCPPRSNGPPTFRFMYCLACRMLFTLMALAFAEVSFTSVPFVVSNPCWWANANLSSRGQALKQQPPFLMNPRERHMPHSDNCQKALAHQKLIFNTMYGRRINSPHQQKRIPTNTIPFERMRKLSAAQILKKKIYTYSKCLIPTTCSMLQRFANSKVCPAA